MIPSSQIGYGSDLGPRLKVTQTWFDLKRADMRKHSAVENLFELRINLEWISTQ